MNNLVIIKILGMLLMLFSITMLPPVFVASLYKDSSVFPYLIGFGITLVVGLLLWTPTRNIHAELKTRDGFVIVLLFWIVLSFFGSIPFVIDSHPHVSFLNAFFESVSGFTTTGASVLSQLDEMPHALLYYRQQLQFFGGIGIIVLALAILPMIGVGGMQLYRAETPGPMKDNKLTPRITQTAKALWFLYLALCVICVLAYWISGMDLFEAVCQAYSTVSTGGFSVHDASFAHYQSPAIKIICMIFMVLGGINFSLHYLAIAKRDIFCYFRDVEFRTYIYILVIISIIGWLVLITHHYYHSIPESLMNSIFNTISLITTTGFITSSYNHWPSFLPILLMIFAIIGACGGSTSGGIKIIRVLLLGKQVTREVKQLVHPNAIYPTKLNSKVIANKDIETVWAFLAAYIGLFALVVMLLMASGLRFESAFGTTVASLCNVGIGIGSHPYNFAALNVFARIVMIFAMLAGRLEVFTLLVIFSRTFWKK